MSQAEPILALCGNRPRFLLLCRMGGWLVLAGLLHLAGHQAYAGEAEVSKEYQIKAAFLYNFTKFVEWPHERFTDDASPIVIAVLGPNPFGDELEKLVIGRKVSGREIVVKSITSMTDAGAVNLLFVTARDENQLENVLAQLRAAGVLTVGESPRFASDGGIITFTLAGDKVRFEINIGAAELAGLKISAQLQKLATTVRR